jgi:hypothetical protein
MRSAEINCQGRQHRILHDVLAEQGVLPPELATELLLTEELCEADMMDWSLGQRQAVGE